MTDPKTSKIALSEIASLEQALDQAPTRNATEVSKARAIGMLAPKLLTLRAKGYAWRDVAAWLTEHGIAVTVPALQRYLRGVKPTGRDKSRAAGQRGAAAPDQRTVAPQALPTPAAPKSITPPPGAKGVAMGAQPVADTTVRAPPPQPRSGFTVRPDTKDI